ncbi:MAG: hypothetical protein Q7S99_13640 [Parvibaculum sp.]|nr:hypothetical protein [Parvibaculum sp.]|tara:strand:+ start:97 stop:483 length:387 start_codon:yes stop_codon:yes gene_type:complete
MKSLLITSGLIQITFAVFQGWLIAAMYGGVIKRFGPIVNAKRVLQCHIDNILMSLLQFAIAAVHPAIPEGAGWLIIIGSWVNAQLFLVHATSTGGYVQNRAVSLVTLASFMTLTIGYPWLLIAWLRLP